MQQPRLTTNFDLRMHASSNLTARLTISLGVLVLCWFAGRSPSTARAQTSAPKSEAYGEELFAYRILPMLAEKCFACHGSDIDELRGEFNMLSREGLLRGGESGTPSVAPGKPLESPLYLAVQWQGLEMPPKENDRLQPEQIEFMKHWIEAGAPWPDEKRIKELTRVPANQWDETLGVSVTTSGGLSEDWTNRRYEASNLWAYQPLKSDRQSELHRSARNPIDVLIESQMVASELLSLIHI